MFLCVRGVGVHACVANVTVKCFKFICAHLMYGAVYIFIIIIFIIIIIIIIITLQRTVCV